MDVVSSLSPENLTISCFLPYYRVSVQRSALTILAISCFSPLISTATPEKHLTSSDKQSHLLKQTSRPLTIILSSGQMDFPRHLPSKSSKSRFLPHYRLPIQRNVLRSQLNTTTILSRNQRAPKDSKFQTNNSLRYLPCDLTRSCFLPCSQLPFQRKVLLSYPVLASFLSPN